MFSGLSENQDGHPGLLLPEAFSTSPFSHWTEFDETWQETRTQCSLLGLCFRAHRWSRMATLDSDCLRLLWHHWTEFDEIWQEANTKHPLSGSCFLGLLVNQDGQFGLYLTFPIKPLNNIWRKLLNVLCHVRVFRTNWWTKLVVLASDWMNHYRLLPLNGIWRIVPGSKYSTFLANLCILGWFECIYKRCTLYPGDRC